MYDIRIEDDGIVRWYKTDNYGSALVLFHLLTQKFDHVQLHKGIEVIAEYTLDWAKKAEARQHENPLCN